MSPDILKHQKVVECFVRNNITPTTALAAVETIIEVSGGCASKVKLSHTTCNRYRLLSAQTMVEKIKDSWAHHRCQYYIGSKFTYSTIDVILTNCYSDFKNSCVLPERLGDHYALKCELSSK